MALDFETLFIACLLAFGYFAWRVVPRLIARVPFVEPGHVKQEMDAGRVGVIIDVRSLDDFIGEKGHIKDAVNLPYVELAERLKDVGDMLSAYRNEAVLVVAGSDNLAAHAVRLLRKAGLANLAILKGGMKKWKSQGLPVETALPE